ncbi:hypothetical protein [Pseudochryseolinea flava]|uniref:Molecular chaperone DnaJ n=1 Tax=Pseudochryseolinea flava TaxID=2059302 RepID=A0A364Y0E6_9BACT|nr:hypothetical protein [Pseudochryseolinea flava]RAW00061.1 hypothetical protein DQQ10_16030 [Pseudochryseolinea flava]
MRLLFLLGIGFAIFVFVRWVMSATAKDEKCSRCDGRGFWYGTRGKEKCEWCRGSGKLPKGIN